MEAANVIAKQLSGVLADLERSRPSTGPFDDYDARRIITKARAAIQRYAPPESVYREEARDIDRRVSASDSTRVTQLGAIVHALRDDYEEGGLLSIEEIVHADLFDDFLEMADELSAKGFIGPAAVLAGTVLEEHLRKLATKHGVSAIRGNDRPKSVEDLGIDLRKEEVITEVQRKSIAAWYAQRNEAAHGHHEALNQGDVERMVDGVRDFVARYAA